MKAAVYAGTRNVYEDMIPSMKSLLIHSDVDKIYFLIEDDEFPYDLPPEVKCINVSNQIWFPQDGPNINNRCSYMVLLRVAFSKLFPELDKILTIDNDTIVRENISDLWDIDLENYYFAGCAEPKKTNNNFLYINMGLAMVNLKKLREDHMDDKMIQALNDYYFIEAEQSCINAFCQGHILEISSEYNDSNYTKKNNHKQKIVHYAQVKNWRTLPLVSKYRNISVQRNIPNNYNLDIIIPSYNDFEGLDRTLKSLYYEDLPQISITVIDDCSDNFDLNEFKEVYPAVNFIKLEKNSGPGAARQKGIELTYNPYIMFIDAGDYIISKICLIDILQTIKEKSKNYIFSWSWINGEFNTYFNDKNLLPEKVFKREFLEIYNIKFNTTPECSYSNEDRGFLGICNLILNTLKLSEKTTYYFSSELPIYFRVFREDSITHKDDFYLTKHIKGLCYNMVYLTKECEQKEVNKILIAKKLAEIIIMLYKELLSVSKKNPEYLSENLEAIKFFYKNAFKTYEYVNKNQVLQLFSLNVKQLLQLTSPSFPSINMNRFIKSLKEE